MSTDKPILLDLFCGGGGASMGYSRAGFRVIGCDIDPQPDYPFEFHRSCAFDFLNGMSSSMEIAAVHASPPCQASSPTVAYRSRGPMRTKEPINLIPQVRLALQDFGAPYVIENVAYRAARLIDPIILCGTMFGLSIYRHRNFELGRFSATQPAHPKHMARCQGNGYLPTVDRPYMTITGRNGHHSKAWTAKAASVMGVPWLAENLNATCEAIPPAYTEYIGTSLMRSIADAD